MKTDKKYKIVVALYGPMMRDGAAIDNQLIAKIRTFELPIGTNPETKEQFARGFIPVGFFQDQVWYCDVKDKDGKVHEHNGFFTGVAKLPSGDPNYIELLICRGWEFTEEFLKPYKHELSIP